MFAWGNCQVGDRLVVERELGRRPEEADLSAGFTPGVRFFFRYADLIRHPQAAFDGVLPLKIRDEVVLADWVWAIVAPERFRAAIEGRVSEALRDRVHFLKNDGLDIWAWSGRVYEYAKALRFPARDKIPQEMTGQPPRDPL